MTSPLDVFDLNKRAMLGIASPEFGRVAYVVIGALQVGSLRLHVSPGDALAKARSHLSFKCSAGSCLCLNWGRCEANLACLGA